MYSLQCCGWTLMACGACSMRWITCTTPSLRRAAQTPFGACSQRTTRSAPAPAARQVRRMGALQGGCCVLPLLAPQLRSWWEWRSAGPQQLRLPGRMLAHCRSAGWETACILRWVQQTLQVAAFILRQGKTRCRCWWRQKAAAGSRRLRHARPAPCLCPTSDSWGALQFWAGLVTFKHAGL